MSRRIPRVSGTAWRFGDPATQHGMESSKILRAGGKQGGLDDAWMMWRMRCGIQNNSLVLLSRRVESREEIL